MRGELVDRFGPLPEPVENLLAVAGLRVLARRYGVTEIVAAGRVIRFMPLELRESQELRLKRLYKGAVVKPAVRTVLVPAPAETPRIGARPLRDRALLTWAATCSRRSSATASRPPPASPPAPPPPQPAEHPSRAGW